MYSEKDMWADFRCSRSDNVNQLKWVDYTKGCEVTNKYFSLCSTRVGGELFLGDEITAILYATDLLIVIFYNSLKIAQ